jgi:hypothetical protein
MNNAKDYPDAWEVFVINARCFGISYGIEINGSWIYEKDTALLFEKFKIEYYKKYPAKLLKNNADI